MQAFDASSMIYAWDNYPMIQFPPLWEWMAARIKAGEFAMPTPAFGEVERKAPDLGKWLRKQEIRCIDVTNEIAREAMRIRRLLGIVGDSYHSDGVGENDILIIATAQVRGAELVSEERRQNTVPKNMARMKIPAVCGHADVSVACIAFVELIKRSRAVFR